MSKAKTFAPLKVKKCEWGKNSFQVKKKEKVSNIYDRILAVEEQKLDKLSSMCSKTDRDHTIDSDYIL